MLKDCRHCGVEFDTRSPHKQEVGGYINECPVCVEEMGGDQTPVIKGFPTSPEDSTLQFIRFESEAKAREYIQSIEEEQR